MDAHIQVKIDPSTNAKFYFNTLTKKSGWHLHEVSDAHAAREHIVAKVARQRPAKVAAAHRAGTSALHPDVQIKVDPNTNARFYYNKKTKKSGWHLHEVHTSHRAHDASASMPAAKLQTAEKQPTIARLSNTKENGASKSAFAKLLHDGAHLDDDIHVKIDPATNARFYYNKRTKKSSWHLHEVSTTRAEESRKAPKAKAGAAVSQRLSTTAADDAHIQEHVHDGKRFYYCTKTGKSSWDKLDLLHNSHGHGPQQKMTLLATQKERVRPKVGDADTGSAPSVPKRRASRSKAKAMQHQNSENKSTSESKSGPALQLYRVKGGSAQRSQLGSRDRTVPLQDVRKGRSRQDPKAHAQKTKLQDDERLKRPSTSPGILAILQEDKEVGKAKDLQDTAERTWCCLSHDNPIRKLCFSLYSSPYYEKVVILPILANVVTLALNVPITVGTCDKHCVCNVSTQASQCSMNKQLDQLEIPFNIIFTVEFLVCTTAVGFFGHKYAYLSDNWNRSDFIIIILGWLPIIFPQINNFSAIRALRVMKVLRTVKSIKSMRTLVAALFNSVTMLANVFMLLVFLFFIFGIIGVQLYSGAFRQQCFDSNTIFNYNVTPPWVPIEMAQNETGEPIYCGGQVDYNNAANDSMLAALSTNTPPLLCEAGQVCRAHEFDPGAPPTGDKYWYEGKDNANPNNGFTNFDNIGFAFLTIFTCISLEGWSGVMYWTMHTRGEDAAAYYIVMILFGAFFVVNLAIAVIYESYHQRMEASVIEAKREQIHSEVTLELKKQRRRGSTSGGTGDELEEAELANRGVAVRMPHKLEQDRQKEVEYANSKKQGALRVACRTLVNSSAFENLMTIMILGNTVILAAEKYPADRSYTELLEFMNSIFTYFFLAEMVLKQYGLGLAVYFRDDFNKFDCTIVMFSVVEMILKEAAKGVSLGFNANFLRVLRLLRIFKLAKKWRTLRALCNTVLEALPGLGNISAILLIFAVSFALVGVQLFGGQYTPDNGFDETPRSNFTDFVHAFMTVFQVMTGEDWNEVMFESMNINTVGAAIFFSLMFFAGNYVMLNLFLAILLENFSGGAFTDSVDGDQNSSGVTSLTARFWSFFTNKLCPGCIGMCAGQGSSRKRKKSTFESRNGSPSVASGSERSDDGVRSPQLGDFADNEHGITIRYNKERRSAGSGESDDGHPFEDTTSDDDSDGESEFDQGEHARSKMGLEQANMRRMNMLRTVADRVHKGIELDTHRVAWRVFHDCFTGDALVQWLRDNYVKSRKTSEAIKLAQMLVREQFVVQIDKIVTIQAVKTFKFEADGSLYHVIARKRDNTMLHGGREFVKQLAEKEAEADRLTRKKQLKLALTGTSLMCLTQKSPFRFWCAKLVTSKKFEHVVYFFISISCISLALINPDNQDFVTPDHGGAYTAMYWVDVGTTIVFDIECVLKIIAMGLYFTPGAYLRDGWNVLDFIVNLASTIDQASPSSNLGFFKALRGLRALRPLRLVSRSPGMKMVVNSILQSLPAALNVVAVVCLVFLVFACAGIQFFSGRLAYCHDKDGGDTHKYEYDRAACEKAGLEWLNPPQHFDNVGNAMLTLYEISTLELWLNMLWNCIDAPAEPGGLHVRDRSLYYFIYFMLFIIMGAMLGMNLFVGVVCDKFAELKDELNGSAFLTEDQLRWRETQQRLLRCPTPNRLREPRLWKGLRRPIFKVAVSGRFELIMMIVIMANIVAMSTEHYDSSPRFNDIQVILNDVFIYIYTVESSIKLIGLGYSQFFESSWNIFDLVVLVFSYAESVLAAIGIKATLLRVFRILRIVRLVRVSPGLKSLLETLMLSWHSLVNVGSVLLLMFFVFGVLGMNLFGQKKDVPLTGEYLNDDANFNSLGVAILTLFRCSTGESWNGIMHDAMSEPVNQKLSAPLFFIAFTILCFFMMVNLFIAVILENFSEVGSSAGGIEEDALHNFRQAWEDVSGEGENDDDESNQQMFLQSFQLVRLLMSLEPPLGIKGIADEWAKEGSHVYMRNVVQTVRGLNLQRNAYGQIFFLDTLHAISSRYHDAVQHEDDLEAKQSVKGSSSLDKYQEYAESYTNSLTRFASKKWPVLENVDPAQMSSFDLYPEMIYALAIQRRFRARRARRGLKSQPKKKRSLLKRMNSVRRNSNKLVQDTAQTQHDPQQPLKWSERPPQRKRKSRQKQKQLTTPGECVDDESNTAVALHGGKGGNKIRVARTDGKNSRGSILI